MAPAFTPLSFRLTAFIVATDLAFLAYWSVAGLDCLGIIRLPQSILYADYSEPRVVAWNWSFLPLDLLFSITGLAAVRMSRNGHAGWRPMAAISLCFTFVAGLQAVSYWSLLGEFYPAWYLSNLALVIFPLIFAPEIGANWTGLHALGAGQHADADP